MYYAITRTDELQHHGVKGQKWGVRRYQNYDGSRTSAGKNRYDKKAAAIQRDIDSFKGHENGIYDRNGKMALSKDDVADIKNGLKQKKKIYEAKSNYKNAKKQYANDFNDYYLRSYGRFALNKEGKNRLKETEKSFNKAFESSEKKNEARAKVIMAKNKDISLSQARKKVDNENAAKAIGAVLLEIGATSYMYYKLIQ